MSSKKGISWSDFKIVCSPATVNLCEKEIDDFDSSFVDIANQIARNKKQMIQSYYLHKVFGYLNMMNQNKNYMTPF